MRLAFLVLALACACHRAPSPPPAPPDQRGELLQRIIALEEVAPCLAEVGPSGVRLVDAELAGEAATVTFLCANGAASGRVTFFRIAGQWSVSTKSIETRRPR